MFRNASRLPPVERISIRWELERTMHTGYLDARERWRARTYAADVGWLLAEVKRLRQLLALFVDDEACRLDHHGYCQAHAVSKPCSVAQARAALRTTEAT